MDELEALVAKLQGEKRDLLQEIRRLEHSQVNLSDFSRLFVDHAAREESMLLHLRVFFRCMAA